LGDRSAAGRRTTTLVLRLDTHVPDTRPGLLWRADETQAAATVTWRMIRGLRKNGCRANDLTAPQMRKA